MAKIQRNKDGSVTYYPTPKERRTGISYDEGKTYSPASKPKASDLAQGSIGVSVRLLGSKPGGEGKELLAELKKMRKRPSK